MAKKEEDWITQTEAAELLNMQLAAINQLVRRGVLVSEVKLGKRVVSRASVKAYIPRAERETKKGVKK
jgi:phage terminase Nu1 subunit (DNA packaging protein)